ncbi:MAG: DUF2330 domain-containing protein [Planctomycetota bacterium]
MTRLLPLALLLLAAPAWACMHLPKDYQGSVEQTAQGALIFWDGGKEDLVMRPAYRAKGAAVPASLAWIIPTPSVPGSYGVVEGDPFKSIHTAWEEAAPRMRGERGLRAKGLPEPDAQGIELLPQAVVGEYTIQPIKTKGPQGAEALNGWLTQNGFGAVPLENMRYYVERDWVWLCVKAQPKQKSGDLRPLRISFASERVVYPLKFSTHQGTFAVNLWVLTRAPLKAAAEEAKAFEFSAEQRTIGQLPGDVSKAAETVKLETKVSVTKVLHPALAGKTIATWKEDLSFTPAESGASGADAPAKTGAKSGAPAPRKKGGFCSLEASPGQAGATAALWLLLLGLGSQRLPALRRAPTMQG